MFGEVCSLPLMIRGVLFRRGNGGDRLGEGDSSRKGKGSKDLLVLLRAGGM